MGYSQSNPLAVPNSVSTGSLVDQSVTNAKIGLDAVTKEKIAPNSIESSEMGDGAVGTPELQDAAVTTVKVADAAITAAKFAAGAVSQASIADGSIITPKIADGAITTAKIADGTIATADLADASVTNAKILGVDGGKVVAGTLPADRITAESLTAAQIAPNAIGASELGDAAVDTPAIADAAVTAAKFAPGAVTAAATADGSLTAVKFATAQTFAASGVISKDAGSLVAYDGINGATLTLPAASPGLAFEIWNADATGDSVTVARAGTDVFAGAITSIVIPAGGKVRVVCTASGTWRIRHYVGEQVAGGFNQIVANVNPGGGGSCLSFVIDGQGAVAPIRLQVHVPSLGGSTEVYLDDGVGKIQTFQVSAVGPGATLDFVYPPFAGSKTFFVRISAAVTVYAAPNLPATLRATWAPGLRTAS